MTEDECLALAFARAIVKPGCKALLINADNKSQRWLPLEDAVASGEPFLVEPRERFLACDVDGPEDQTWAEKVRVEAEIAGCRVVVVNSGQEDHQHLWITCPPGWTHAYAKDRMISAGAPKAKVRTGSGTRPPYAPHRLPGLPRAGVVDPGRATALKWFREGSARPLSSEMRDKLARFDPETASRVNGKLSHRSTLYSVALAAVNAGWELSEFIVELQNPANATAEKWRGLGPAGKSRMAQGLWDNACAYVREHPPLIPTKVARGELEELASTAPNLVWSGRTGTTDRAVYLALISIGHEAGMTNPTASVRQLAEAANLTKETARRSLGRLAERKLIRRQHPATPTDAARWLLLPLAADGTAEGRVGDSPLSGQKTYVPRAITGLLGGGERPLMARSTPLLADVFTNGSGLGIAARETWQALTDEPLTTAQVVARRPNGLTHPTTREHLKKLHAYGFAVRTGNRWTRREPSESELGTIARTLGVKGKTNARKEYHARERTEQLKWLTGK